MVREQERQLLGTKKTAVWIIWTVQVVHFLVTVNLEIAEFVNLVFRVLSYVPTERAGERPWLGLVTCLQNKINSEGGVLCLSVLRLARFHRSYNDCKSKIDLLTLTTVTETMRYFCPNRTATR